jgi:hypothetical protein
MARSYYKGVAETWSGATADQWFEFDGLVPARQVTRVGDRWLSSLDDADPDAGPLLTDQLLFPGEFPEEDKISAGEFERVWQKAVAERGRA